MSLSDPSTHRAILIDLEWVGVGNTQQTLFLTNWTSTLEIDGRDYISTPGLEVELPTFNGGWERDQAKVTLETIVQLLRNLALGRAFSTVTGRIRQVAWEATDLTTATMITLWKGDVIQAEVNPEGRPGTGTLQLDQAGGPVDVQVTPICSDRCWKSFGDQKTCTVDRNLFQETGTVQALDGLTMTITGLTTPTVNYWVGGDVDLAGARVKIRSWAFSQPTIFELGEYPPQEWVDAFVAGTTTVTVRSGCDRSKTACRFYDNEINWGGGIGAAMPLRDPNLELE